MRIAARRAARAGLAGGAGRHTAGFGLQVERTSDAQPEHGGAPNGQRCKWLFCARPLSMPNMPFVAHTTNPLTGLPHMYQHCDKPIFAHFSELMQAIPTRCTAKWWWALGRRWSETFRAVLCGSRSERAGKGGECNKLSCLSQQAHGSSGAKAGHHLPLRLQCRGPAGVRSMIRMLHSSPARRPSFTLCRFAGAGLFDSVQVPQPELVAVGLLRGPALHGRCFSGPTCWRA